MKDQIRQRLDAARSHERGNEGELVERARRGDKQALGELYSRHVDTIFRYVLIRVKVPEVAEDITAQVFLKAVEGLPNYRPTGAPFLAWLYRIACARVADHWRHHYRYPEADLPGAPWVECPDPGANLELESDWCTAVDLVSQLTEEQQMVIMMRFLADMSLSEIAVSMAKTTGAVKAIQHRAVASLARLLRERER